MESTGFFRQRGQVQTIWLNGTKEKIVRRQSSNFELIFLPLKIIPSLSTNLDKVLSRVQEMKIFV